MNDRYPMEENQNLPAPRSYDGGGVRAEVDPEEVSPITRLHQLLRGRYIWVILLGLLGAAIGGTAAWFSIEPVYESRGMVQVRSTTPRIIYETEQNRPMPNFSGFVGTQAALIQHNRVLRHALDDQGWRALGRDSSDEAIHAFRSKLEVTPPRSNEFIVVSFQDPNRDATRVAVRAVLQAYDRIHVERDRMSRDRTMRALTERRTDLNNQINNITQRILNLAQEHGSDSLDHMYQFQLSQVQRLEASLQQTQMTLSHLRAQERDGNAPGEEPGFQIADMTPEEIGMLDPRVRRMLDQRDAIEQRLRLLVRNYGENHREVRAITDQLAVINESMDERIRELAASEDPERLLRLGGSDDSGLTGGLRIKQLEQQVERLQSMHADARRDMLDVGRRRLEIDRLRAERENLRQRLQEARYRFETLEVESAMAGRIDVLADEGDIETSLKPVNARRRLQMTAGSLFGGAGAGLALVLLVALIDRRVRTTDDATRSIGHLPLLGVLPQLPEDLADPDHTILVAHAVHHIRTLLQLSAPPQGRTVYAVSSPAAGSGKTSLTIALGMSFANAGNRTLILDCDLSSSGLTQRMRAIVRRRIGQVLLQQGLVTREQLEQGLHAAEVTGRRLGEALIAQGVVNQEQLSHALAFQEQSAMGLLDAMHGDALADCIAATGTDNLSILPVGGATVADLKRLSPKAINRVIEEARHHYDVILVDTGPVPGSMESSTVAATADAVVFVVSRGDQRPRVERSITFLESIGASLAGFVFNRADPDDDGVTNYSARSERFPADGNGDGLVPAGAGASDNGFANYGPVAGSMDNGDPQSTNGHPN